MNICDCEQARDLLIEPTDYHPPVYQNEYATLKEILTTHTCVSLIFDSLAQLQRMVNKEMQAAIAAIFRINTLIVSALEKNESSAQTFICAHWFFELNSVEDITEHRDAIISCYATLAGQWNSAEINRIFSNLSGSVPELFLCILQRYHQLCNVATIDAVLEKKKLFKLACCIEQRIKNIEKLATGYFKKELVYSPRTVAYDSEQKAFFILLKEHSQNAICRKGIAKKMTVAIYVPDDTGLQAVYVAQCVNLTTPVNKCGQIPIRARKAYENCLQKITERYECLLDEFEKHKAFSGNKGIWPILGYLTYTMILPNCDTIPKVTSFAPLAKCDLWAVVSKQELLSIEQFLEVTEHLTCGLHYLHTHGYIHGDLKPENALLGFVNGEVCAGLNDFGLYYVPGEDELPSPWTIGYYGSKGPTSPELFGNRNFTGDPYKVEIWAFGCLLLSVLFQSEPAWYRPISMAWEGKVLETDVSKVLQQVTSSIEKTRTKLMEMESRSLYEECVLLIYDMMRLNPEERPDTEGLLQRISDIKQVFKERI